MKLKEVKGQLIVSYSRNKEPDLTWRKVREWCFNQMRAMKESKEWEDVQAITKTIAILQRKVDSFNERFDRYAKMAGRIHDSDRDIDDPFVKDDKGDDHND